MPTYRLLLGDWRDGPTYARCKVALWEWVQRHAGEIVSRFPARCRDPRGSGRQQNGLIVVCPSEALADLPVGLDKHAIRDLTPTRVVTARVRDREILIRGVAVRGTRHFAPGTVVYPHGKHSGDGYERVYVTGTDREDGRLVTMMCRALRFEDWRVELVDDPRVIFALRDSHLRWATDPDSKAEQDMEFVVVTMNERVARDV